MPMRNAMIQGKYVLGFAVIVCLWLVASVHGAGPGLFEAAHLERLPALFLCQRSVCQTWKAKNVPAVIQRASGTHELLDHLVTPLSARAAALEALHQRYKDQGLVVLGSICAKRRTS